MPVYNNLKAIRKLSNSSLTSIIDITNLNFRSLSDGTLEFLNNIRYNESLNTFEVFRGTFDFVNINDRFSLNLDGIPTFTIDSLGRAEGQELLVKVAETRRLRLTDFNDWPDTGVPGEIIYTGIQNQRPEFGEDFIGYLQGRGWVSLTDNGGTGFITLTELTTSPPVPGCPTQNKGILWIGPPGYAGSSVPTTQTLYYTDENCSVYDLLSDPIWEKVGTDAQFKLDGTVIIGETSDPKQLRYVDGNQAAGYVLTSDAFGNASWQPNNGGGGGGGACAFVYLEDFVANVTSTITHNLNSTNLHVQLVRTDTNELIDGYIDNYQSNSVDITLTQTINNVKVIILSANCSGGGGGGGSVAVSYDSSQVVSSATDLNFIGSGVSVTDAGNGQVDIEIPVGLKKNIKPSETVLVKQDYQYFIYGNLTVEGVVNNYGEVVIANGTLVLVPGGQFNNLGSGILTQVNLATGDSMQVVVKTINTIAFVPETVVHGLGTKEFTFNIREGNTLVDIDYTHVDDNTIDIVTTANLTGAVMVFHAKI